MNGIKPIDFTGDDTSAMQTYLNALERRRLADANAAAERLKEEVKQKQELMKLIDPMVLSKNLEAEVADAGVNSLRGNISQFIRSNPGISSTELQSVINSQLGLISEWNNKVRVIKGKLDEQFKNLPQDNTISKSNWMNAALTDALYKTETYDEGGVMKTRRVLKNAQELDTEADFATKVWDRDGDKFINLDNISSELSKRLKDAPTVTKDITVSLGASRGQKGFTKQEVITMPSFAVWDEQLGKPVVKTKNGLIDSDIYTGFVGAPGSANDRFVEMRAKSKIMEGDIDLLKSAGFTNIYEDDGETISKRRLDVSMQAALLPENRDRIKKAWLGNHIEETTGYTTREKEVTKPAIVYLGSGKKDDSTPYIDVAGNIITKVNQDAEARRPYTQVNDLGDVEINAVLSAAKNRLGISEVGIGDIKLVPDGKGGVFMITANDIETSGGRSYKAGTNLGRLGTGANISGNKPLGQKAVRAAVGTNSKLTGAGGL